MSERRKVRLDLLLTQRGLVPTRSRARDLIKRGVVMAAGRVETRAGAEFAEDAEIAVTEDWSGYVSRGSLKLAGALDHFGFECDGRIALDIGASTGGFTQVLLRRGARTVYAVDTGSGQLHADIAGDPRVVNLEKTDARALNVALVPEPPEAITADVSFISLTKALPAGLALAAPGAWAVALVKPQFEAGPDRVGKGGIVRDEAVRAEVLTTTRDFLNAQPGWSVVGEIPSPISGQSGNIEYLIGARYAP
ncbi:MAG: TlyA family RNA methyltransferase [Rhodomicrobiaceae bacterium]